MSEQQTFWTFSQKTGTCVQLTGCYTIRDRNVWLTRQMCRNNCRKKEFQQRSSVLPNFLADAIKTQEASIRRGRRGRLITRNSNPAVAGSRGSDIVVSDVITTIHFEVANQGQPGPTAGAVPIGTFGNVFNLRP